MIYLHEHFFGFVANAEYFQTNDCVSQIQHKQSLIGIAFYKFYLNDMIATIEMARSKCQRLIVYIKEPFSHQLIALLQKFEHDKNISFFGDAVLNSEITNWVPAVSWFVSPRHYYQLDDWAKNLLDQVEPQTYCRDYKFDCLLGTKKNHRDWIEARLTQSEQKKEILFSYFKHDISQGIWNRDVIPVDSTWQSVPVHDIYEVALSALIPYYVYNQSHHSIVAESTYFNDFNHITEKIAKPIMAERIFVAFCGQYYLRSLRRLGFQTFDSIIDESYDLEPDMATRFEKSWAQVEYLCRQDPIEIRKKVCDVLSHNRQHFLITDWHDPVKKALDQWCLKSISE
jgi:hypothetical protein